MKMFFYGTLKQDCSRSVADRLLRGEKLIGKVNTSSKYRLFTNGAFPGMIEDEKGVAVPGELWEVSEQAVPRLDAYEGHPHLFKRGPVEIDGHSDVQTYFWCGSTEGRREIPNWV